MNIFDSILQRHAYVRALNLADERCSFQKQMTENGLTDEKKFQFVSFTDILGNNCDSSWFTKDPKELKAAQEQAINVLGILACLLKTNKWTCCPMVH
jgi:hypothetical protein